MCLLPVRSVAMIGIGRRSIRCTWPDRVSNTKLVVGPIILACAILYAIPATAVLGVTDNPVNMLARR